MKQISLKKFFTNFTCNLSTIVSIIGWIEIFSTLFNIIALYAISENISSITVHHIIKEQKSIEVHTHVKVLDAVYFYYYRFDEQLSAITKIFEHFTEMYIYTKIITILTAFLLIYGVRKYNIICMFPYLITEGIHLGFLGYIVFWSISVEPRSSIFVFLYLSE